jgi:hypothetical protein
MTVRERAASQDAALFLFFVLIRHAQHNAQMHEPAFLM